VGRNIAYFFSRIKENRCTSHFHSFFFLLYVSWSMRERGEKKVKEFLFFCSGTIAQEKERRREKSIFFTRSSF